MSSKTRNRTENDHGVVWGGSRYDLGIKVSVWPSKVLLTHRRKPRPVACHNTAAPCFFPQGVNFSRTTDTTTGFQPEQPHPLHHSTPRSKSHVPTRENTRRTMRAGATISKHAHLRRRQKRPVHRPQHKSHPAREYPPRHAVEAVDPESRQRLPHGASKA